MIAFVITFRAVFSTHHIIFHTVQPSQHKVEDANGVLQLLRKLLNDDCEGAAHLEDRKSTQESRAHSVSYALHSAQLDTLCAAAQLALHLMHTLLSTA
jgi:hypothetical protein